jgi:hypothetical protein
MPEYTIAARGLSAAATSKPDAATGRAQLTWAHKIRPSIGIRRNSAALNPNDAIELSKVSMTNLRSAGAETPCNMRVQVHGS